jgi:hypothetical protein
MPFGEVTAAGLGGGHLGAHVLKLDSGAIAFHKRPVISAPSDHELYFYRSTEVQTGKVPPLHRTATPLPQQGASSGLRAGRVGPLVGGVGPVVERLVASGERMGWVARKTRRVWMACQSGAHCERNSNLNLN